MKRLFYQDVVLLLKFQYKVKLYFRFITNTNLILK